MKHDYLILFDGDCALCNRAVHHILQIDRKEIFCFAPLKGKTATEVLGKKLEKYQELNTLVLVEEFSPGKKRVLIRSKAVLRILWLTHGIWKVLGLLSFLPAFLGDSVYKIIARHRHGIKAGACKISEKKHSDRFLP